MTQEQCAAVGRFIVEEYDRQLRVFQNCNPRDAHLLNPSFDFGSCIVRSIIDKCTTVFL